MESNTVIIIINAEDLILLKQTKAIYRIPFSIISNLVYFLYNMMSGS